MLQDGGCIQLIMGPMFAGKTSEMMRRVKLAIHARRKCFVIKYRKDVRYTVNSVASHDQTVLRAQASVCTLSEVKDAWEPYDVIAVDEGQFFPDLVHFCDTVANAGKTVLVSALDGDYRRQPFGQVCALIPLCEQVEKMAAVCMMCHARYASFTRRIAAEKQQELIGGAEAYSAVCRTCYNSKCAPSTEALQQVNEAIKEVEQACLGTPTSRDPHHEAAQSDNHATLASPQVSPAVSRNSPIKLEKRLRDEDDSHESKKSYCGNTNSLTPALGAA